MIIVSMEEPAILVAVHRIIGCIKIQNDLIGSLFVRCNKLLDKQRIQIECRLLLRGVFEPAKCRCRSHLPVGADSRLQNNVFAKLLVII